MKRPVATPDRLDIYAAMLEDPQRREDLGDQWEAARAAGVKAGTIDVWVTRGKITPVIVEGEKLFHLPTVRAAAQAGRKFRPADPAANSRGPHAHAA